MGNDQYPIGVYVLIAKMIRHHLKEEDKKLEDDFGIKRIEDYYSPELNKNLSLPEFLDSEFFGLLVSTYRLKGNDRKHFAFRYFKPHLGTCKPDKPDLVKAKNKDAVLLNQFFYLANTRDYSQPVILIFNACLNPFRFLSKIPFSEGVVL